jgi:hypothetical protein
MNIETPKTEARTYGAAKEYCLSYGLTPAPHRPDEHCTGVEIPVPMNFSDCFYCAARRHTAASVSFTHSLNLYPFGPERYED